ncbi:MAG: excinuclease ABC subunit UvrA [Clostridia bacterium]|nr:excinuclease ABC subunit UvrA [Clostridia bacterium]
MGNGENNVMETIRIKGAKENNLKSVNLEFPRNKLVVFTGVSGSGKTSLAFDTLFAEGQRRYMESLSSYARQFLGQMEKPDVESIDGLSPAISIDQKTTSRNPRSTVGTVTEIYDYLRLLYARLGTVYCPDCGALIKQQSIDEIVDRIMTYPQGDKLLITSPIARGKKGEFKKELDSFKKAGYPRVRIDGKVMSLDEDIVLDKQIRHNISVVVDRIIVKEGITQRLTDSVETALKLSDGIVIVVRNEESEELFSTKYSCSECGASIAEIEPRLFSFNSPFGACPECTGLGFKQTVDPQLLYKDGSKSIREGALTISGWNMDFGTMSNMQFSALAQEYGFSLDTPYKDLPEEIKNILLYGNDGHKIQMTYQSKSFTGSMYKSFEGVIPNLVRRYKETSSMYVKAELEKYMREVPCECCKGKRLRKEALSVKFGGLAINELCSLSIHKINAFFAGLQLSETQQQIAKHLMREIKSRLNFLVNVGLGYLTLSRGAGSLSGGEAQRIRLATQIGSSLTGVLYILDEPSIGLHQRDNAKLIKTMENLRDLGNTLVVVEHDEDTIRSADFVVDVGPGAGEEGGEIVHAGSVVDLINNPKSITGEYLSGKRKIEVPTTRRPLENGFIVVKGARQNNLKNIDVRFPLGVLTAVTGVSGSGKSSLVNQIVAPYLSNRIMNSKQVEGDCDEILGAELIDKVIIIDQSPIGRTPRSNPVTYTGVFNQIRDLFAKTRDSQERGYTSGRFSFNVKGGRCENCTGDGIIRIEMNFLPDVYVPCEVCKGKRYNRETLQVKYKDKSIADVLNMTVDEATEFFKNIPSIYNKISTLKEVGLGYIRLGQPATTLSGGEAQRVKLATELSKRSTSKTFYILDEPTTGLHMDDVSKLIKILQKLVSGGNTVVVIEHNLDVIKVADHIIDMGPEGGDEGGTVIAQGTPEEIAQNEISFTGKFLKPMLNK